MQEAGDIATDWRPVATAIKEPDVTVNELSPRKDYNFRIRAELENGEVSEPTPAIQYHRSKVPMTKEPFALAEYKPVQYDHTSLNRTYIDHLTKYVPPRLPIDKPDMIVLDPETVELSWRSASVPESIRLSSNLTYTIEVRNPPSFEWRELVSGLKVLNHKIPNLHNKVDYVFRVRAWNEYGCSEASLPVSIYRPIDFDDPDYYDEDEEFEREWELRFGHQDDEEVPIEQEPPLKGDIDIFKVRNPDIGNIVPPKLPIDTPRTNTQTETSIWFTWLAARIPAYATQTPITYVVEVREPPSTNWRRDATGITDCQYIRDGLDPKKDYHIRVRAETEFGTSEPTLPIMIQRPKGGSRPGSRLSSMEREMKDDVTVNTSFLDNLTSTGPPRMTAGRPQCSDVQATSLTLSWAPSRVPSYVKSSGVSYIVERREPPGHIWCVVSRDIAETSYQVLGLNPEQDYMFRVRAKNEHGISDPTLPVSIYRERDDYVPQKVRSRSGSRDSIAAYLSIRSRRSSSIDYGSGSGGIKSPREETPDNKPRQPEYLETSYDTQFGVEGKKGKITLKVKGYPLPTVHWYFGEEKLKYGDQFNAFVTPLGEITLEFKTVSKDSVGEYKCYAENEHGASVKVVTFALAEPPTVLEPLTDQVLLSYNNITLACKVDGFPKPSVKWMKDWKPLAASARIEMNKVEPEDYTTVITNGLASDSGVYACVVENAAGKVTTACRLTVEDVPTAREVVLKSSPIEEFYTILEEVRRGEHGVTRRVVEVATGNSYEATFLYMRNRAQKNFFLSEFEVLRTVNQLDGVLKIHDAFETERSLVIVTEALPGTSLLEKVTADGNWTESDVATVIRNLLNTLKEFENLRVLYLDMRPSNVRMCGADGKNVKLVNFAMSRIRDLDEDVTHNYGTVGYASPEQITNDVLTGKTDTWGIGVLAYILLTGNPPFTGETDTDILNKAAECQITFDDKDFGNVSKKAQDFIQKLLVKQQSGRMTLDECMRHPWVKAEETRQINTDRLSFFNNAEKASDAARQVQSTAILQSLSKIRHGTAALYQPAIDTKTGEIIFPDSDEYGDYLDEDSWYEWQLQYCDDPDSQNFPLMDANFTVRESKHTAEKKRDLDKDDPEESEGDGSIFFRNKIQPVTFTIGDDVSFMCTVVSTADKPVVTWYRDETLLSEREAYRTDQLYSEETGIAQLTIQNTKDYDGAVYKCVARNKEGRVSCEARLILGDKPAKPGRPVVVQTSGSEAFLTWSNPITDGNSYILGYRVDYRKQGTTTWVKGPYMTEEYALVSGLVPQTNYVFRVSCHNKYGSSPFSWASKPAATVSADAPAITITSYLQPLLQFSSFTKQQLILPAESRRPSLSVAPDAKVQKGNPADFYDLGDTVSKGKYGEYKLCTNKTSNRQCVAKVMPFTKETHVAIKREFEILKNLRQLHIITVLDAYIMKEYCYVIFEHLSGLNILQYLCLQKSYKEDTVARVVKQILDALQYLQTYGIAHLNLQPSSVAMSTRRRPHIKLRDFTIARKLKDGKVENMKPAGYPDFVAPEVIKCETVACQADLWSLGALTFTLLSGVSPFEGSDLKETLGNVLFDRYKASDMYDNVTKESIRFINKLLRRLPANRPTVSKCLKSRWLQLGDQMLNSRNTRTFHTERLRDFLSNYTERRADSAYMDIASVPVEELPKPTPGPIFKPILSDKVTNRFEFKPKTTARMEREELEKIERTKPVVAKKPVKKQIQEEKPVEELEVKPAENSLANTVPKTDVKDSKIESKTDEKIAAKQPVGQETSIKKAEPIGETTKIAAASKEQSKDAETVKAVPKVVDNTDGSVPAKSMKESEVIAEEKDKEKQTGIADSKKNDNLKSDSANESKVSTKESDNLTGKVTEKAEVKSKTDNKKSEPSTSQTSTSSKTANSENDGNQVEKHETKDTKADKKPEEEGKQEITETSKSSITEKPVEEPSIMSEEKADVEVTAPSTSKTEMDITDSQDVVKVADELTEKQIVEKSVPADSQENMEETPIEETTIMPEEKTVVELAPTSTNDAKTNVTDVAKEEGKSTETQINDVQDVSQETVKEPVPTECVPVKEEPISAEVKNKEEGECKVDGAEVKKETNPETVLEDEMVSAQKTEVESEAPEKVVEKTEETQNTNTTANDDVSKTDNSNEVSEVVEPTKDQVATSESPVANENTSSEVSKLPEEDSSKVVVDDAMKKPETIEESQDSDDSEIQKLEKDAIPEKLEQVKEEPTKAVESKEEAVKELEEPNEEKIADLCTAIDDALMFC